MNVKSHLPLLFVLTISFAITACGSKKSSSTQTSTSSSRLSIKEVEDYKGQAVEMLKNNITTITITKKNGCVMQSKELRVDLGEHESNQVHYIKSIKTKNSKGCNGTQITSTNQVEVLPATSDDCTYSGTKTGQLVNLKSSCDTNDSLVIDLTAKTLKLTHMDGEETMVAVSQATTIEREQLLKDLAHIDIVYYKNDENDKDIIKVEKKVTGNANDILNLGL